MSADDAGGETRTEDRRNSTSAAIIMATLALLVSVASLGVSIYEAQVLRGQQRAMSWPYIQISTGYSEDGFGIYVANKGAGPALVAGAEVFVGGVPVTNALSLIRAAAGPDIDVNWGNVKTGSFSNIVLEPSESSILVETPWNATLRQAVSDASIEEIEVSLCYCSIFRECWVARMGETAEQMRCEAPETPYSP